MVFVSAVLLLLAALVYVHFALKSGELTQQAVPALAPYLKPLGIELQKLGSARIDSLRSVQLRNIQLVWRDPALGEVQFTAARFDAFYDLPALLSNKLQIDQVLLEDARIRARLHPAAETQAAVSEEPASLQHLSELLRAPPMPLLAKAIHINHVELDLLFEYEQGAAKQSLRYKGLLQQIALEVQWQANLLKGNLLTALGQDGQSALLVSQTQQGQTLELEAAPAIRTQTTWELNYAGAGWNLQNAMVEDHLDVPPMALFQRLVQGADGKRTQVGSVAAVKIDMTSRVNSVAKKSGTTVPKMNAPDDLTGIFPVKVSASLTTAVKDLILDGIRFQDAQISGQADHEIKFKLDGEVDPLALVFKDFHIQSTQLLTVAALDAQSGGQHAVLKDLSLQFNTQANTPSDASVHTKNTLPLNFTADMDGRAQHIELKQAPGSNGESALDAQLRPQFTLSASGQLHPFKDFLQALSVDFQPRLILEDVAVRTGVGGVTQEYRIARQQLSSTGSYKNEILNVDSDLNLERVAVVKNVKPFSTNSHIHLSGDVHFKSSKVSLQTSLDKQPILALDMETDNQPQRFSVQNTLQVDLPKRLRAYYPALADLRLIGSARINGSSKTTIDHGADSVLTADFTTVNQWPVTLDSELRLTQLSPPKMKNGVVDGIVMAKPVTVKFEIKTDKQYRAALHAEAPSILVSPLQKPLPLRADLQSRFTWPLTVTDASGNIEVQGEQALQFDMKLDDQPRHARLDSHAAIIINPQWRRYLAALKDLGSAGRLASDWQLRADVEHPYNSITLWDPENPGKVKASISLATELKQLAADPKALIRLPKPVTLTQQLHWSRETVDWQSQFSAVAVEWAKHAKLQNFAGNWRVRASPGDSPTKADLALHLDKAEVLLMQSNDHEDNNKKPMAIGQIITPLNLHLAGAMDKERIHIDDIKLDMANDLVALTSTGSTSLDGQSAQLESSLKVTLRPDLMTQPAMSGKGSFGIPRLLTIKEGDKITVDGEMQFNDLDTAVDDFQIKGLNGRLLINEELQVTPEPLVKFRYLVHADPFQRVDFTRLQPYLDSPSLQIQNITMGDKSFGPVLANMSLKQNLLRLPRIDMDLLGGHLSGQFYFDASPGAWKIALLGRLSQLDPRQLLPDFAPSKDSELSPMSARVAMEFDLNQKLLEGRMDVTEISREQLLQLLDVMDPAHQDEQLAQVRTALRLAYPKSVSLAMEHGLMDMTVVISTLPKPIKVYGLPLTPLIQHFAGDTLDKLGGLPLE